MSADNTVTILETNGPEYRVADIQASENIFYFDETGDLLTIWDYFHSCKVFTSFEEACSEADRLVEQCIKDIGFPPEYGTSHMTIAKDFPKTRPECPDHSLSNKSIPPSCYRCGEDK